MMMMMMMCMMMRTFGGRRDFFSFVSFFRGELLKRKIKKKEIRVRFFSTTKRNKTFFVRHYN